MKLLAAVGTLALVSLSGESLAPVKENGWSDPTSWTETGSDLTDYQLVFAGVLAQNDDEISQEKKLCADKTSGELFRLQAGKDNCRDVIQCTAAVSLPQLILSS